MKYQIRYNHRSTQTATSAAAARNAVRFEMCNKRNRLYVASAPDGDYCYRSKSDRDADDTGARAFAVICGSGQQQD